MGKIYLVELNIFKENMIYSLQEILLDNFSRNFYNWSAIMNCACMQKIKIGHRAKFQARNKYFVQILFLVRAILHKIFMNGACMQKNQDRSQSKISSEKQMYFVQILFPVRTILLKI